MKSIHHQLCFINLTIVDMLAWKRALTDNSVYVWIDKSLNEDRINPVLKQFAPFAINYNITEYTRMRIAAFGAAAVAATFILPSGRRSEDNSSTHSVELHAIHDVKYIKSKLSKY